MKQLNDSDPSTTSPLMEGTPTIRSRKKLLQIIDTTLLKCYLHVRRRLFSFLASCVLWCCCSFVVNKGDLVSSKMLHMFFIQLIFNLEWNKTLLETQSICFILSHFFLFSSIPLKNHHTFGLTANLQLSVNPVQMFIFHDESYVGSQDSGTYHHPL